MRTPLVSLRKSINKLYLHCVPNVLWSLLARSKLRPVPCPLPSNPHLEIRDFSTCKISQKNLTHSHVPGISLALKLNLGDCVLYCYVCTMEYGRFSRGIAPKFTRLCFKNPCKVTLYYGKLRNRHQHTPWNSKTERAPTLQGTRIPGERRNKMTPRRWHISFHFLSYKGHLFQSERAFTLHIG